MMDCAVDARLDFVFIKAQMRGGGGGHRMHWLHFFSPVSLTLHTVSFC